MNERRNLLQRVGLASAAIFAAVGTAGVAQAKPGKGKPFEQLRAELLELILRLTRKVRRLSRRVDELAQGQINVAQLQISNPDGGASGLIFGETGECRIEVNPEGPGGLLLTDPDGVRILAGAAGPAALDRNTGASPTLAFGPTDECRIRAGGGMFLEDPFGFQFRGGDASIVNTDQQGPAPALAFVDSFFDIDVECRGRACATAEGMQFSDAASFQFNGAEIQAVTSQQRDGELMPGGLAFVDSFFDVFECRGRACATVDGMLFSDAASFQFASAEIQAVSTKDADGTFTPGGLAFVDSFFDIDVECRGRACATADGMQFSDAASYQFTGAEIKAVTTGDEDGNVSQGGISFFDVFFDNDAECRGRIAADVRGMSFSDAKSFNFAGPVAATEFVQNSSGALKENVRPINDALDKICALQGVYFDWKADQGGHSDVGFIGEEVNLVLPQLVAEHQGTQAVSGVKYANIVAVAVEGIKAQQSEIERLQGDNETLRDQVGALQARFEDLAARMG